MEEEEEEFTQKWTLIFQREGKIDLCEKTCLKTFNFRKSHHFEGTKLARNIKELPYARNILKIHPRSYV